MPIRTNDVGPIAGRQLKIASTDEFVLTLNNALGGGAGNNGDLTWHLPQGSTVLEAWYSVEDNIPALVQFGNITVRPSTVHRNDVEVTWVGIGVTAAIRPRLYALYLV